MTGPWRRTAISAALGLALCLACAREPESPGPTGDPSEAVAAYFEAIAEHDCAGLEASVAEAAARKLDELGCEETIAEFEEHGAALDGVESVVVDGRDPSLRLVRTRLRAAKGERVVVIGVRFVEGRWRVVRI